MTGLKNITIQVGGHSRDQLKQMLVDASVHLNTYADEILNSSNFKTSHKVHSITFTALTTDTLGFSDGACLTEIQTAAQKHRLSFCPAESAPYLRLALLDQPRADRDELQIPNKSPTGALTICSPSLSDDPSMHKGFYLINIDGVFWLRGFRCDLDFKFQSDDILVLQNDSDTA